MGLDKQNAGWFYGYMRLLSALNQLGLGSILKARKARMSPLTRERIRFEADMREQFEQLKKKGLSIPVFTL